MKTKYSIVSLRNLDSDDRLDAEYYQPEYLLLYENLKKLNTNLLIKFAYITDGEHGSPEWDENSGIRYITAERIKENYLEDGEYDYISKKQDERNARSRLNENDVLIYSVGIYAGLASKMEKHLLPANIPRSVAIMRLESDEYTPEYLSLFLNSKYGKFQTARLRAGNAQPMLALEQIKKILIPKIDKNIQRKLSDMYNEAYSARIDSKIKYQEAVTLVINELHMSQSDLKNNMTYVLNLTDINDRLDAEYYQPKYKRIIEKIKKYEHGYDLIKNRFNQNKNQIKMNQNEYAYIEIGDISIYNGELYPHIIKKENLPDNAKIALNKGNLLISKVRPNRGAIAIFDLDLKNPVASGAFTVLSNKDEIKIETLAILLKTEYYRELLLKYNIGASYPVIKDEDILNLPIPLIERDIQERISEKIKDSQNLLAKSRRLLEQADQIVEKEIERMIN